tara:strand:+ start:237 stop:443 length:207 start_codon:yes stop_codon:yes gene_type:complete
VIQEIPVVAVVLLDIQEMEDMEVTILQVGVLVVMDQVVVDQVVMQVLPKDTEEVEEALVSTVKVPLDQ